VRRAGREGNSPSTYDERKWRLWFVGLLAFEVFSLAMVIAPEHFITDYWRGPQTPAAARWLGAFLALFGAYVLVKGIRYRRTNRKP
jgi:hypothetical protein